MPSAIEAYHAAKLAVDAADEVVDRYVQLLKGVLIALEHNAPQLLHQKPQNISEERAEAKRLAEEMAMAKPLEEMPTREMIAEALLVLDAAHKKWFDAHQALSEIEQSYVAKPREQRGYW